MCVGVAIAFTYAAAWAINRACKRQRHRARQQRMARRHAPHESAEQSVDADAIVKQHHAAATQVLVEMPDHSTMVGEMSDGREAAAAAGSHGDACAVGMKPPLPGAVARTDVQQHSGRGACSPGHAQGGAHLQQQVQRHQRCQPQHLDPPHQQSPAHREGLEDRLREQQDNVSLRHGSVGTAVLRAFKSVYTWQTPGGSKVHMCLSVDQHF